MQDDEVEDFFGALGRDETLVEFDQSPRMEPPRGFNVFFESVTY